MPKEAPGSLGTREPSLECDGPTKRGVPTVRCPMPRQNAVVIVCSWFALVFVVLLAGNAVDPFTVAANSDHLMNPSSQAPISSLRRGRWDLNAVRTPAKIGRAHD